MKKRMLSLLLALVMLVGALSVAAAAKGAAAYQDVSADDWFYGAVGFVTENGLMTGTHTGFEPQRTTSRAMLWTILSRLDGQSAKRNAADWYAAAQLWAVQNDISDGTAPDAPITREQLASMLYRYAQRRGLVRAASSADLSTFVDAAAVSAYAEEAVQWAVEAGLLNGMGGKLCPQGAATRAQVAEILRRMCEKWDILTQDNAAVAAAAWLYDDPEHTHSWTYTANKDGTHTATCTCGETKTEYCTLVRKSGKNWECSTCGFVVEGDTDAGVSTWNELKEAVENGKSPIYLAADIAIEEVIQIKQDTIFYGCEHTLTYAESYPSSKRTMFRANGKWASDESADKFELHDLILDGSSRTEKISAAILDIEDMELIIDRCEFKNFTATKVLIAGTNGTYGDSNATVAPVKISNTSFHDNTCEGYNAGGPYNRTIDGSSVLHFFSADVSLENVMFTKNTVSKGKFAADAQGNNNLIFIKNDNSEFSAKDITITENSKCSLFSTYSVNASHTIRFESGLIKNEGSMWVCTNMYIGKTMKIECREIGGWNSNTKDALVYENDGELVCGLAKYGDGLDTIYTGTGTHIGSKTNIIDQTA